jgi:subtilisin family serine protease
MKARSVVWILLAVLAVAPAAPAAAAAGDKIVRTKSLDGLPIVSTLCKFLGCKVVGSLDLLPGQTSQPSSLFLVRGLVNNTLTFLLSLLGVASVEPDLPVAVAQDDSQYWATNQATAAVLDQLWDRTAMSYYGSTAWEAYLRQPAAGIVRLRDAHCDLRATGGGIVAVIDTGVDPDHPALKNVLVSGYDFTRGAEGGSEKSDVDQATAAVLDGTCWVNQATAAVLDQATAAVLDDPSHSAFGHGTMVAGVVHLVAPTARIMPLKAFQSDGQGYTSDVLRAIYYATQKGAKVINMSFSRPTSSSELKIAIDNATRKGVIAVSSAGNDGKATLVYPAAYDNVIGVASTTNDDVRASFSNYGSRIVWVAAPGEGIITTYPFGSYAAAWGTSFSTPMVSGLAALVAGMQGSATPSQVASVVAQARLLTSDLGYGRVDLYKAVEKARSLWPDALASAVPDSCGTGDVDWSEAP